MRFDTSIVCTNDVNVIRINGTVDLNVINSCVDLTQVQPAHTTSMLWHCRDDD